MKACKACGKETGNGANTCSGCGAQHVSDAARDVWLRQKGVDLRGNPNITPFGDAGIMLVTFAEFERTDLHRIALLCGDITAAKMQRDRAVDALTKANQSLLDANLRIEWLERQLAKNERAAMAPSYPTCPTCGRPTSSATGDGRTGATPISLTEPNLTDPRFGT